MKSYKSVRYRCSSLTAFLNSLRIFVERNLSGKEFHTLAQIKVVFLSRRLLVFSRGTISLLVPLKHNPYWISRAIASSHKTNGLPEQIILGQEEKKWHFCAQLVKGEVSVISQEQLVKLHVFWQRCWLMRPPVHFSSACDIVVNRATPITTAIWDCRKIL